MNGRIQSLPNVGTGGSAAGRLGRIGDQVEVLKTILGTLDVGEGLHLLLDAAGHIKIEQAGGRGNGADWAFGVTLAQANGTYTAHVAGGHVIVPGEGVYFFEATSIQITSARVLAASFDMAGRNIALATYASVGDIPAPAAQLIMPLVSISEPTSGTFAIDRIFHRGTILWA